MAKLVGNHPRVFLRYHGAWCAILVVADLALLLAWGRPAWSFHLGYLALTPFALYLGALLGVAMHNAGHRNFSPAFLNRFVLEAAGLHQLDGWRRNTAAHIIHHKYPDDADRDPHPPLELGFWRFALSLQRTSRACLRKVYLQTWGDDEEHRRIWRVSDRLAAAGTALRLPFWLLLLGPALFLSVYLPSLISNALFFAHLNYSTHRPRQAGGFEILNLNHHLGYRLANRLLFGTYYHRSHHRRSHLFNPMRREA